MNAHEGARAFAIEIKIADVEFAARAFQPGFVSRVHRARQSELRIVGYPQRVIIVVCLDHCEYRSKDLFLLDRRTGFNVRNHSGLDKESLFAIRTAARHVPSALGLS